MSDPFVVSVGQAPRYPLYNRVRFLQRYSPAALDLVPEMVSAETLHYGKWTPVILAQLVDNDYVEMAETYDGMSPMEKLYRFPSVRIVPNA